MKILLPCSACTKALEVGRLYPTELTESGLYEFTCEHGHNNRSMLTGPRFDLLFEVGCNAIVDGYHREAISSFTAALERFREFYIRAVCHHRNVETKESWKTISKQSERQLGAFIFVHLLHTGEAPPALSQNHEKLRNEVIHKGRIPNRAESLAYGNDVREIIWKLWGGLIKTCPDSQAMCQATENIEAQIRAGAVDLGTSFLSIGSAFCGLSSDAIFPLEEHLAGIAKWKQAQFYHIA